jgi:hypothetical protein
VRGLTRQSRRPRDYSAIKGSGFAANARMPRPSACPPMVKKPRGSSPAPGSGTARIESRRAETRRAPPPLLYDLTELQRHANRLYGFSAQNHPGPRPEALRTAQADQLSAHRQPPFVGVGRGDFGRGGRGDSGAVPGSVWRWEPASARWAPASWTTPRSPIITPLFPRRLQPAPH